MGFNDSGQISLLRLSQPAYARQQGRSRVVPAPGEGTRGVWGAAGHQGTSLPLSCSDGAQKRLLQGMQWSIAFPQQHLMGPIMAAEASPAESPPFPARTNLSANDEFFGLWEDSRSLPVRSPKLVLHHCNTEQVLSDVSGLCAASAASSCFCRGCSTGGTQDLPQKRFTTSLRSQICLVRAFVPRAFLLPQVLR